MLVRKSFLTQEIFYLLRTKYNFIHYNPFPKVKRSSIKEFLESDEEDEESDEESDTYGRISSSSDESSSSRDQSGGGGRIEDEDESKYPNQRYYINRLTHRDPGLFDYKTLTAKDAYARRCQATKDLQPIVVSKTELLEIDNKTGFKNEGW